MARPAPRNLEVLKTQSLTPHMQRITLGGTEMADFPEDKEGGYLKLHFPDHSNNKPAVRTYTIRHHRVEQQEFDVDFVLHGTSGIASAWAINTKIGDRILVAGPGPRKSANSEADWFFFAGDMTALPAISVNLERLPADAKGYAVFEISSEEEKQNLRIPVGIEVYWVITSNDDNNTESTFCNAVKALPLLTGIPSIWVACEFKKMRELRQYFKKECLIDKQHVYASSYWKKGINEEEHKVVKGQDNQRDD